MVAIAYLLAHLWWATQTDFVRREYIILGIGLAAVGILPEPQRYATAVVFAIGWAGIDFGLHTDIRKMLGQPSYETRIAVVDSLCTILIATVGSGALFYVMSGSTDYHWDSAVVIGCIAATARMGPSMSSKSAFPTSKLAFCPP